MEPLICHLVGDYLLQSDWMAQEKRRSNLAATVHVVTYTLPFLLLSPSSAAIGVIVGTHLLIDRFGLARYVVWAKNLLAPRTMPWCDYCAETARGIPSSEAIARRPGAIDLCCGSMRRVRTPPWRACTATGYAPEKPEFLAVWLTIIADNTLHLVCNYAALRWL